MYRVLPWLVRRSVDFGGRITVNATRNGSMLFRVYAGRRHDDAVNTLLPPTFTRHFMFTWLEVGEQNPGEVDQIEAAVACDIRERSNDLGE